MVFVSSREIDELRMEVGRLIQVRGLLQEAAAKELGVSRTTLFRFLEGISVPRRLKMLEAVLRSWQAQERQTVAGLVREHPGLYLSGYRCPGCGRGTLGPPTAKHCIHCGVCFAEFACGSCGGVVEEGAKFCPGCGTKKTRRRAG